MVDNSATIEPNTTFEIIREPRPIITAQSQREKSFLTMESEVLKYPDILNTAHEFGALTIQNNLQTHEFFGDTIVKIYVRKRFGKQKTENREQKT